MPQIIFPDDAADRLVDHVRHAVMYQSEAQRMLLNALRLVDDAVAEAAGGRGMPPNKEQVEDVRRALFGPVEGDDDA